MSVRCIDGLCDLRSEGGHDPGLGVSFGAMLGPPPPLSCHVCESKSWGCRRQAPNSSSFPGSILLSTELRPVTLSQGSDGGVLRAPLYRAVYAEKHRVRIPTAKYVEVDSSRPVGVDIARLIQVGE